MNAEIEWSVKAKVYEFIIDTLKNEEIEKSPEMIKAIAELFKSLN